MKKLIYLLCIIQLFLFPFSTYAANLGIRGDSSIQKVSYTTKSISGKDNLFSYDIQIPVFSSIENTTLQRKLNKHLQEEVLAFKNNIMTEAKNASELAKQNGWKFQPYSLNITYKVTHNQKGILSFILRYDRYTGGAHGLETWVPYNIHLKDGSKILLENCFKEDVNFRKIIRDTILTQMEKESDKYFPDATQKVTETNNFQFYLDDRGFVFFYPLYEIAPYTSGIPTFSLPVTTIYNKLK